MRHVVGSFVRLRWRLLRGSIRHGGAEQVGAVVSTVMSILIGLGVGTAAAVAGRTDGQAPDLAVIFCAVSVAAIVGFGIVAGITQPIDPRVIAAEPLSDLERATGLLAGSAFGPPGLAGMTIAIGIVIGMTRRVATFPLVVLAAVAWLLALLLVARTATNLLSLLISRAPRIGQLTVGVAGLVFYGAFQFVPAVIGKLDSEQRSDLAEVLEFTPPGQVGRALGATAFWPGALHLTLGAAWLPLLGWALLASSRRLAASTRRVGGLDAAAPETSRIGRAAHRACGTGARGAIAWRSLLTRFRTPRTALESFTGGGVGLAAVLVPTLARDTAGSGSVLVGGAVQLAVLFMSGNSLGNDGPAVTHELLAGAELRDLVAGKARSIAIVAAPLAVVGPLLAAAITGEWRYLVAGFGVGAGGLLAGTGAAIVQSALVPIAIPESDNPFAGGETGKGLVAALLLVVVLGGLAIVTLPVALALLWATDRGVTTLVTLFGALTVLAGWLVMRAGVAVATRRLAGREPEFVTSVTPSR
jgi:hypothetical protein